MWFLFTGDKKNRATLGGVEVVLQAGVGRVQNPSEQETHTGYGNCTWSAQFNQLPNNQAEVGNSSKKGSG
jgi:hypothetical protein